MLEPLSRQQTRLCSDHCSTALLSTGKLSLGFLGLYVTKKQQNNIKHKNRQEGNIYDAQQGGREVASAPFKNLFKSSRFFYSEELNDKLIV